MRDEGYEGQHSILTEIMPWGVKIKSLYPTERKLINKNLWILVFFSFCLSLTLIAWEGIGIQALPDLLPSSCALHQGIPVKCVFLVICTANIYSQYTVISCVTFPTVIWQWLSQPTAVHLTLTDIEEYSLRLIAVLCCNNYKQITVANVTLPKALLNTVIIFTVYQVYLHCA